MQERLKDHTTRLGTAKQHISIIEDGTVAMASVWREEITVTIATKNEDLEGRLLCNNIGPLGSYVELLLIELLGRNTFTATFAVGIAHRSLGPHPCAHSLPDS
ncbi:hypothetical protein NDU88_010482 [Pleurodeles waltl]|uniref:Uncharacterized protein n=1 Tax=Pleurodeles waltl TaxID=8319 RepID=A0AAV7QW20_PLEWA|nr:hypothetical protein NDU88_010482 [Pleurodeles waltl]